MRLPKAHPTSLVFVKTVPKKTRMGKLPLVCIHRKYFLPLRLSHVLQLSKSSAFRTEPAKIVLRSFLSAVDVCTPWSAANWLKSSPLSLKVQGVLINDWETFLHLSAGREGGINFAKRRGDISWRYWSTGKNLIFTFIKFTNVKVFPLQSGKQTTYARPRLILSFYLLRKSLEFKNPRCKEVAGYREVRGALAAV